MKRRTIVAFAIVAAVLTATAPVAAQSDQLVVASYHSTDSELSNGDLNNMSVVGSGQSASAVLDYIHRTESFEDEPADSGVPDRYSTEGTPDAINVTTKYAESGTQSTYVRVGDGSARLVKDTESDAEPFTENVSLDVYVINETDGSGYGGLVTTAGIIAVFQGDLVIFDSGDITTLATQPNNNEWVNITTKVTDPGTNEITVWWSAGSDSGSATYTSSSDLSDGYHRADPRALDAEVAFDNHRIADKPVSEGEYISPDHSVSNAEQAAVNLTLQNAKANVTVTDPVSGAVLNQTNVTTTANHTFDLDGQTSDKVRTYVRFYNQSGRTVARLHDESILFAPQAPNITSASPDPDAEASDSEITLSADIEDPDLGTAQGDSVTAEFYMGGQKVDEQSITSNQTVSTTVEPALGGTHNWSVEVEDSYGQTDSIAAREFNVPAVLSVYYETEPETLVDEDNLSLSMQFYPLGEGDIQSREVTDGTVDLTGLPVGERFVVTVKANESDKFVYRRIVLDSIYDSEKIFLLRENETHSDVVFELQDPTGQFPPEETELVVEKPITINGSTDYYPIAGDTFGASGRFPAALENDERYRLRVVSNESERILGAYTATGDELVPLQIQHIEPSAAEANAGSVYGSLTENGSTESLAVRFRNGQPGTDVTYRVTDEDTGDVVVPETTTSGVSFAHMYEFDANDTESYNVSYEVSYPDGETQTGYFIAGQIGGIADRLDIDPQVLSIMSWVAILASAGLVVIVDRKLAPAVGTGVSSLLTIIGTVAIPMPVLGIAGAISVLTLFGGRQ